MEKCYQVNAYSFPAIGQEGGPLIGNPWVSPLIGAGLGFMMGGNKLVWALAGGLLGWGIYSWYQASLREQPV